MICMLPKAISPKAYQWIADLVYQHSRIRLGDDRQALVVGRLGKRLRQLGLDSFESYCRFLDSAEGAEELGELVDLISTNHTHFFREIQHLHYLRDHVLGEMLPRVKSRGDAFRVWSAACSSGEEPYSVGIVLAEYARTRGAFSWQIEASDISSRILEKAQDAIYSEELTKSISPELVPRYFQKGFGEFAGSVKVKETLRQTIKFHRVNLLQGSYPVSGLQHVIFCRNVMIYFDTATQQELINKLVSRLAPGGYLMVGHSESLLGVRHTLKKVHPAIYRLEEK